MTAFCLLLVSLSVFSFVCEHNRLLRTYRIPASLTGAVLLLIIFQVFPQMQNYDFYQQWKEWPAKFIALVFAALFLQSVEMQGSSKHKEVAAETLLVWITMLGQMTLAILCTLFVFRPFFGLPMAFAAVLEGGFSGGHGTAAAYQEIMRANGFVQGGDFTLFSATIGIVLALSGGVFFLQSEVRLQDLPKPSFPKVSLDPHPLVFSLAALCLAYWGGDILRTQMKLNFTSLPVFPLFAYTIFTGLVLKFLIGVAKQKAVLSNNVFAFSANFFMDLLILSGVATLNLTLISEALLPLAILFAVGFAWNVFSYKVLSRRILPAEYSRELAILNFGVFNGTTAIGLLLLKIIDPEFKSPAIRIFAESVPFYAPFLGGGLLTLTLPYILFHYNPYLVAGCFVFAMFCLFALARWLAKW
ncbi:MAG: sodium/glutamate symporter [Spirochaetota bacterium]